ncbi:MAG: hypothetical protein KF886_05835 [Candidatus Hydrogenedentes bacterium]|nr:hypothetical protein [Candidatus Hydrogenedentota bacterium]
MSRKTLSSILNGHAGIGPEMAVRLSIALPPTADASPRGGAVRRAEQRRGALKVAPLTLG